MRVKQLIPFTPRDLMLAIGIVAVLVGAFVNCQIVRKSLAVTQQISTALPRPEK
jgi:hypothetical protein